MTKIKEYTVVSDSIQYSRLKLKRIGSIRYYSVFKTKIKEYTVVSDSIQYSRLKL